MMRLFFPIALLAFAACTAKSTDGPIETCADVPDCWKAGYEGLLSRSDFLAFDAVELEACSVSVAFRGTEREIPPIENEPVFIVSEITGPEASFDLTRRTLVVKNVFEEVASYRGGLMGFTRYVEDENPTSVTTIQCAGTEYTVADDLWVAARMKEKPSSGMTGSPRVEGSQRPWQDLVDFAISEAQGESSIEIVTYAYWYPASENGDAEPAEGEVPSP